MEKRRVLITGAGIAGLTLARELARDFDVTVLEAQDRAGGRIHSVDIAGTIVERGAEFVHGRLPATLELAREAGVRVVPVKAKMYQAHNGGLSEVEEMDPHWDELLEKMKAQEHDLTLTEFLTTHFSGQDHAGLRQRAVDFAGGFDLADADLASVKALYREWSADQEENFRIPDGYGALVNFLVAQVQAAGSRVLLSHPVEQIDMTNGMATATTTNGELFSGSAMIVTVPVAPLREGVIRFSDDARAIRRMTGNIGMGNVIRFVFGFRKPLWPADAGFIFSEQAVPTWWTGNATQVHQLVGWAGGNRAMVLSFKSEEELLQVAIDSLAGIFNQPAAAIEAGLVFKIVTDWSVNPWSLGGYSYSTPLTADARRELAFPVKDVVWFAGEGYAMGEHPGTVEAAMVHAREVAMEVGKRLKA